MIPQVNMQFNVGSYYWQENIATYKTIILHDIVAKCILLNMTHCKYSIQSLIVCFQSVTEPNVPFKVLKLTDPTDEPLTDHGTTDVRPIS